MIGRLNEVSAEWARYFLLMNLQSTLFLGALLGLLYLLRRQPARLRHGVSLVGLLKLYLPPLLLLPGAATWAAAPFEHTVRLVLPASAQHPTVSMSTLLMMAWLATALGLLGLAARRTARLYRIARRATPAQQPSLAVDNRVRVLMSRAVKSPLVFGWFRPCVLVPMQWEAWPEASRRAVLAHELAHIRRRDLWTHLLVTVARAAYFFNPLVWLLSRRLTHYAEMACDEAAVSATGLPPGAYARQLVFIAEAAPGAGPVTPGLRSVSSSYKALKDRLVYLLDTPSSSWSRLRSGVILGCLLLALVPFSWDLKADRSSFPGAAPPQADLIRYEPPLPVGGYGTLVDRLASQREVLAKARQEEGDVTVQVRLDRDGTVLTAEHVVGGCESSFAEIREAILAVHWQPARQDGAAVASDLSLTFASAAKP